MPQQEDTDCNIYLHVSEGISGCITEQMASVMAGGKVCLHVGLPHTQIKHVGMGLLMHNSARTISAFKAVLSGPLSSDKLYLSDGFPQ